MFRPSVVCAVVTGLVFAGCSGVEALHDVDVHDAGTSVPDGGTTTPDAGEATPDAGCGADCPHEPRGCVLPGHADLADGESVTSYATASVACGETCASTVIACHDGELTGGNAFGHPSCAVATCAACPATTVEFDWGSHEGGPCRIELPAGDSGGWYYTPKTDDFLGGFSATCDRDTGSWQIQQEKCVPRNGATTCFPAGTRCDGSGPASFPYPHCWTCCNATDPVPGTCH